MFFFVIKKIKFFFYEVIVIFIYVDGYFSFLSFYFKNKGRFVWVFFLVVDFVYIIIVFFIIVLFECYNSFKVMIERFGILFYLFFFIC